MKIRKHDVGYNRWHLTAFSDSYSEDQAFYSWMTENCPECLCVKRSSYGMDPYWEVRGSDTGHMMLIMMRWG